MGEEPNNSSRGVLKPIDPYSLLKKIKLSAGKAAEFCGISRRQLCYWTDQGIIPTIHGEAGKRDDASRRVYDFDGLTKAILVKQAMAKGQGLQRAAKEVELYLEERKNQLVDLRTANKEAREEFLLQQAEKLEELAQELHERVTDSVSSEQLLKLANTLESLAELSDRSSEGVADLRDDPEASHRLRTVLEQLEVKMAGLSQE